MPMPSDILPNFLEDSPEYYFDPKTNLFMVNMPAGAGYAIQPHTFFKIIKQMQKAGEDFYALQEASQGKAVIIGFNRQTHG